ncbi:hypothetical protein C8F01DRAFT_1247532 [Mycena amicta]|nr:hypothetical protein C8F01DRAFT_1247532 [Mycena amicta]
MASEAQQPMKEHTYSLFTKSGKPWATLLLLGDAERAISNLPALVQGEPCTGKFMLDLESTESIHTVVLSIRGQIITGARPSEMFTFLDISRTLWSQSMGDPSQPGGPRWTKSLKGQYTWPFSLAIPVTVSVSGEEYRMPQSFFERHTRGQIEYEISVKLMRPMLRSDYRLSTILEYLPVSRPSLPSGLRQLAYEQHTALLGPDSDPDGWTTLPVVKTSGQYNSRPVEASCKLCYSRGTSIPCALQIECNDPVGLDILASPDSVVLRLRRNVRFHSPDKPNPSNDITLKPVWKDEFQFSEMASWWLAAVSPNRELDALDSTETLISGARLRRTLKGELHLRSDLITSSFIAHYCLEYAVVLLPFDAQGYKSLDTSPLIVQNVEIASDLADGPRPLIYSIPFETRKT